jgi:hypothetical protein
LPLGLYAQSPSTASKVNVAKTANYHKTITKNVPEAAKTFKFARMQRATTSISTNDNINLRE